MSTPSEETDTEDPRTLPARRYEQTETAVAVMRHLRRLARSKSYVRKTEVWRTEWRNHEVDYVDPVTGEVTEGWRQVRRRRKVNRRFAYLRNQTHGFLAVNDGEQAAHDIARLLGGSPPLRKRDVGLVS